MVLKIRHIYFTDYLFINDVLHLNIPYPQFWKVLTVFTLLFLFPFTFNKSPLDKQIAKMLHNLLTTMLSIITPKRFLQNCRNLIRSFNKISLLAIIVFAVKSYLSYVGVKVENEGILFNQPVIHRAVTKPWDKQPCKLMNATAERRYLMWEVGHCSKIKRTRGYHKTFYVPSVTTVDGSEQRCLPHHKTSCIGRVDIRRIPAIYKNSSYEHPVSKIKHDCKEMGTNCDFIKRAISHDLYTYIDLNLDDVPLCRVEHSRSIAISPQESLIREVSLAAKSRVDKMGYPRWSYNTTSMQRDLAWTAFGVRGSVAFSPCFKKSDAVDTIKVPILVIHLVPLLLLFVLEHICRRYFERLADAAPGEGYDEHLKIVMEEALS